MPGVEGENRRAVILKILVDRASVGAGRTQVSVPRG